MGIPVGTKLGVYEVVAPLGSGGMGEVYKARDSRLDRTVAIKVLSGNPAFGSELKARFEREARAIAQLQHPHICTLYDVGQHEDTEFLVMEYLEGESLAERLKSGPLPIEQVVNLGIDIATALDRAHSSGFVHRDLKPGNIMLTKSGAKLLDFGLAKSRATSVDVSAPLLSAAVTMSSPIPGGSPLTTAGTIVGTIQYMSPEQIQGKEADARSDIFAFGAVLYEALSGKATFEGKSQLSVASAILEKEPEPISTLLPTAPAQLNHIIQTCLAKDPEARYQCAHDIAIELRWIGTKPQGTAAAGGPKWFSPVLWVAIPVLVLLAAAIGYLLRRPAAAAVVRSEIAFAEDTTLAEAGNFALSPDGTKLAVVAKTGPGKPMLWIRSLDALKPRRVEDTDDAAYPFWSPDSRYVGFFTPGQLRKLDTASFLVSTICAAQDGRGGTWNNGDVIVFTPTVTGPLFRVSSNGGDPTAITKTDSDDQSHRWPQFLPDGDHLLYVAAGTHDENLMATSLSGHQPALITHTTGSVPYSNGYLLVLRTNTLVAQAFDPESLKLSTTIRTLAEKVAGVSPRGSVAFSASGNGELVYQSTGGEGRVQLAWIDSNGKKMENVGEPGAYYGIDLSPDGKRVLLGIRDPQTQNTNYWMMDVQRGVVTRFTLDPQFSDVNAQWSHDSKFVLFSSNRNAGFDAIYRKPADGAEAEQLVFSQPKNDLLVTAISADDQLAAFFNSTSRGSWVLPLTGGQKPYPFTAGESNDQIVISDWSPDKRWVFFTSRQTGRSELYVTSFPQPHGRWQISSDGATGGGIRSDGKKLEYINNAGKVIAVDFDGSGSEPRIGKPEIFFDYAGAGFSDVSGTPDWKHFIAGIRLEYNSPRLVLVTNWLADMAK